MALVPGNSRRCLSLLTVALGGGYATEERGQHGKTVNVGPAKEGGLAEFTPAMSRHSALLHHGEEVPLPLPSFRVQNRTFLGQVAEVRVITRGPVKRRFPGLRFL